MSIKAVFVWAAALAVFAVGSVSGNTGRDYLSVVGSSTVYPFSLAVAKQFSRTSGHTMPRIESTGSGGGLKLFCAGIGSQHPDITNASRPIKKSEVETCRSNGVRRIVEMRIGYDGVAIANSKRVNQFDLGLQAIYLALAERVPDPDGSGALVLNPYTTWREVDPSLPDVAIKVLGPPSTSGTRDAFMELAIESGCRTFEWIKATKNTDESLYRSACRSIREDGAYVDAGENDNLIVHRLVENPDLLGIFGFSFLEQNSDSIQGSRIDGIEPGFGSIASGQYPLSRPLFFYLKPAHVNIIPGIRGYLAEFTSEHAWGDTGYLAKMGLVPMPRSARRKFARVAASLRPLPM